MNISVVKVKQYSSSYKNILMVDGVPVCIVRGTKSLNDCISYLMNCNPSLKDGKVMKLFDKLKGGAE